MRGYEDLPGYASSGMPLKDIAAQVGATYGAVRLALYRRGIRATDERDQTIRQKAEGMLPQEAVRFLLDALEQLAPVLCGTADHPVDAWNCGFTRMQRRLVIIVYDARGSVVPYDTAMSGLYFDKPGDHPGREILSPMLHHIRARMPLERGRIATEHSQGLRWVAS